MKPVKNLLCAVLLVAALALNTVAGDVQTPGVAAPQPSPSPTNAMTTSAYGISPISDQYSEQSGEILETSDSLFYEALVALLSVY